MSLNRLWSLFPGRRTFLTVLLSFLAGAALAMAVSALTDKPGKLVRSPGPPFDPQFVVLGQTYLPQLGKAYAAAWEQGAKQLDAGQSITTALEAVSKAWSANRTDLYDHVFTPAFARIVAESVNDADVTPAERAALAAVWRGLALGLAK